jgi:hypothetical protein
MSDQEAVASRIDRLLDAIDLVKANRRDEACDLLRELIREDNDFEDAWMWMSVAVESLDESSVCLDNALRINPRNQEAAGALFRIRAPQIKMETQRTRLRFYRDMALGSMWLLVIVVLFSAFMTIFGPR